MNDNNSINPVKEQDMYPETNIPIEAKDSADDTLIEQISDEKNNAIEYADCEETEIDENNYIAADAESSATDTPEINTQQSVASGDSAIPHSPYVSYNQQQYAQINQPVSSYQQYATQNGKQNYAYPNETVNPVKKKGMGIAAFIAIACVLVIGASVLFAIMLLSNNTGNSLTEVPKLSSVSTAETPEEGLSAAEVYQKIYKSSVSILAYDQTSGDLGVLGSGVIFQEDESKKYTYVVTCAHVINDSTYNLKVELWDGSVYSAEVVNYDDGTDIGVIRIKTSGLQIAEFADSDTMQPGATVYAIGSPYSSKFAGTFTRGMVSAINRLVTTQTSYQLCCIQHDAAINNGNSGGALVNAYGQVVGINALKINTSNYEGLGFAVPSNTVIKVINSIIETGIAPKAAKLGISYVQAIYYSQFLSDVIEENNLPAGAILVAEISKESSLYNTEMKINDIIIAVNGQDLNNPDLLVKLIQESTVGDTLELTVVRIHMNEDNTDYTELETYTITASLVELNLQEESNDQSQDQEDFYDYFGDDSGNYEDFYNYFYDYFYGENGPQGDNSLPNNDDNQFSIPE